VGADPKSNDREKAWSAINHSILSAGRIEMDGTAGWRLFALVLLQKVKMVQGGGQVRQTGTGGKLSAKDKGIVSPDGYF
jgi:hypothetical protein